MAAAVKTKLQGGAVRYTWNLTTADATGDAVKVPLGLWDRTIHSFASPSGGFGGGTIVWEGTTEDTPTANGWKTLKDDGGDDITVPAPGRFHLVAPIFTHARPRLTGSTGADVQATMIMR